VFNEKCSVVIRTPNRVGFAEHINDNQRTHEGLGGRHYAGRGDRAAKPRNPSALASSQAVAGTGTVDTPTALK
jgi:hypothetical protein